MKIRLKHVLSLKNGKEKKGNIYAKSVNKYIVFPYLLKLTRWLKAADTVQITYRQTYIHSWQRHI